MSDDYSAIRQLCERYVDAINRRDADAWVETWAPDGVWEYGGDDLHGAFHPYLSWKDE